MRHILLLIGLLVGLLSPAAAQQAEFWSQSGDRLRFEATGISLPRDPAVVRFKGTKEFSRKGEGLDTALQYQSPDGEVWATAYVYLSGVAHAGLASLATTEALKLHSENPVTVRRTSVVPAGGAQSVAIRIDFDNYRGDNASSAAFIKADRWLIKLRVTGPEQRAGEVDAVMTALLEGLRFEGKVKPSTTALIAAEPCPAATLPDAMPIAESKDDPMANVIGLGLLDPAGERAEGNGGKDTDLLLSRIGTDWCRGVAVVGETRVTFLRATGADEADDPRTKSVLLVLYSDAGGLLEVARRREGGFVLLNHGIATTEILGMLDKVPSDRQIVRYLSGAEDEILRRRATITLKRDGGTETQVTIPEAPPTA